MPLRDHFRPPVSKRSSWEGLHVGWPAAMMMQLNRVLPATFVAEPRVHLGTYSDMAGRPSEEEAEADIVLNSGNGPANGGVAIATWAPPAPSLTVETEFPEQYAYEVLIFDLERERQLVAAVEIVSPANKDRPDSRQLYIAKCANLLQKGVCVSLVDLVTVRNFNLYVELLALLRRRDPAFASDPPPTYAATCRKRLAGDKSWLDTWSNRLTLGQPLPKLPIRLADDLPVLLDLEESYEAACRVLKIN